MKEQRLRIRKEKGGRWKMQEREWYVERRENKAE